MTDTATRQAVVAAPGVVRLQPAAALSPAPGEAVVRMRMVGICGSDVHAFHARHPFVSLPYAPGHEILGTVEVAAVGLTGGEGPAAGTRVVVEPILACG